MTGMGEGHGRDERIAACGQEFRAFDGLQKCGRVKGHPGAHTRDPLPSDRRAFDAAGQEEPTRAAA